MYFTRQIAKRMKLTHDFRGFCEREYGYSGPTSMGVNFHKSEEYAVLEYTKLFATMEDMSEDKTFDADTIRKIHPSMFWGWHRDAERALELMQERADIDRVDWIFRNLLRDPVRAVSGINSL